MAMDFYDLIHERPDGWWFWNETGKQRRGPFDSYEHAKEALRYYVARISGDAKAGMQAIAHLGIDELIDMHKRVSATKWEWDDRIDTSAQNVEEN
jgi:hypothetical protein